MDEIKKMIDAMEDSIKVKTFIDLSIKDDNKKQLSIPVLILHPTDIYVFMEIDSLNEREYKKSLLDRLYILQKFLKRPVHHFDVYGCYNNETWVHVNPKNNNCDVLDNVCEYVQEWMDGRVSIFTEESLDELYYELEFGSDTKDKIKIDKNGIAYVRKGNMWYEASEDNTESLFYITLLGGWLGLHKFKRQETKRGILYLVTFGLFGVGWLIDILRILLGVEKGEDEAYLLPVENPKMKWLMFLAAIPAAALLIFCHYKILSAILSGVGMILDTITGSTTTGKHLESILGGLEG